jgi:Mrp family chromosome partitioning ATPase/uncharacterized protein involved in exopolysaccharide biosynthesis
MKDITPQPPVRWASPEAPAPLAAPGGYPDYGPTPPPRSATPSLGRYLEFLRRKWWLLLLTTLACVGLALAYLTYWPAKYASSAYLWVTGKMGVNMREGPTYSDDAQSFYGTQVELLQSPQVMLRAVTRLRDAAGLQLPTGPDGQPLLPGLRVSQLPKSAVFELKVKGPDTNYVQPFLNAVMDEFLAYKKEVRVGLSSDAFATLSAQVTRYESDLKAEQEKLTTYQRENNTAVLEEQAKTAGVFLTQLHADFSRLKLETQILEAVAADKGLSESLATNAFPLTPDARKFTEMSLPAAGGTSSEFIVARQQLEMLKIQRTQLGQYLRPKHPDMIQLDEEIARAGQLVDFFGQQSRDQLGTARETMRLRLPKVLETIKEWETKVSDASQRLAELDRMKTNIQRVQGLYDRLLGLLQTVDVSRNLEQENFSVLQKASDPKPANLSPPIALGLAVFMGIGAGLALIFLVERMDDRLLSLDEVSHQFMEWVVGQVPEVHNERKKRRPALLEGNDPRHIFAESYRSLRSALLFGVPLEAKPKTLLVTSAIPSEGKSTVAANLARTLAFGGSRVLLIDADLRRGVLHDLFGVAREPGLAELLARNGHSSALVSPGGDPDQGPGTRDQGTKGPGTRDQGTRDQGTRDQGTKGPGTRDQTLASFGGEGRGEEAPALDLTHFVVPTSIPNLFLLPCGGPQDRSGELLLGHRLDALLAQARADYDCVIMDSIPVFAADDTTSLAPKMDGVIFVVRNSFSSAGTVRGALEMLYERQARVLGLVYNRANPDAKSYHYYKYAAYDRSAKRA